MDWQDIQPMVQLEIKNALETFKKDRQYAVADIPVHEHNGTDSINVNYSNLHNRTRYMPIRIVDPQTNNTVSTGVGGDFVMPFEGYLTDIVATVDTAGTTGTMTIDVKKNGTSIFLTKLTLDTTEKTSRTGATPYVFSASKVQFVIGDIFTFNVDAIQTTPAKGLTMLLYTVETSP